MTLPPAVEALLDLALEEDLGRGDVTTWAVMGDSVPAVQGRIVAREDLVLSGMAVALRVFEKVSPECACDARASDGDALAAGSVAVSVSGPADGILAAERTALNFLQRLSGVATLARRFAEAVAGTGARVVDTRKTTPGWRFLERRAVRDGGLANHRFDLGSGILIKDNHIAAAGGVRQAVERALSRAPHGLEVEVEVGTFAELEEAIAAGASLVLLDNMDLEEVRACVARARAAGVTTEVSGGVTLKTVRALAETGVDLISVGALTHSAPAVDLSLELDHG